MPHCDDPGCECGDCKAERIMAEHDKDKVFTGEIMRRLTETEMDERYGSPDIDEVNKKYLRELTEGLEDDELRLLRSIINGKLGKREISLEQQAKMQAARKRKVI